MADLTTAQVWAKIEKELFGIIGMVTVNNKARTTGIVYIVKHRKIYFGTASTAWKTRHIAQNPHVSMTIPIAKQIPFLPWIKIPQATITFSGLARVLSPEAASEEVVKALLQGTSETDPAFAIIEVTPQKEFVTYGVGVSLLTMRDTVKARGRVAVE